MIKGTIILYHNTPNYAKTLSRVLGKLKQDRAIIDEMKTSTEPERVSYFDSFNVERQIITTTITIKYHQ